MLLWIITMLGAVVGGLQLLVAIGSSQGAPQQAAGAAMAVAFAVIPYVLARAWQLMHPAEERELRRLNETLSRHTAMLAQMANSSVKETEKPHPHTLAPLSESQ